MGLLKPLVRGHAVEAGDEDYRDFLPEQWHQIPKVACQLCLIYAVFSSRNWSYN